MGCYYMTMSRPDRPGEGMVFASVEEVHRAFAQGKVVRHSKIKVRLPREKTVKGEGAEEHKPGGLIATTAGRV